MFKCVVAENIHSPPTERNGNFNGGGVGNFRRGGGGFSRSFFREFLVRLINYQKLTAALLSKLSVILLFLLFLKQKLLYSSMIFYLRSAEFFSFFHGLRDK